MSCYIYHLLILIVKHIKFNLLVYALLIYSIISVLSNDLVIRNSPLRWINMVYRVRILTLYILSLINWSKIIRTKYKFIYYQLTYFKKKKNLLSTNLYVIICFCRPFLICALCEDLHGGDLLQTTLSGYDI